MGGVWSCYEFPRCPEPTSSAARESARTPGVAMALIVQADDAAGTGFVRRRISMLRSTEITWGNGRIRCPT